MTKYLLLTAQTTSGSGDPPIPVMIAIILACLFLPYFIHRYTGKSLGEWFSSITLLGRLGKRSKNKEAASAKELAKKSELEEKKKIREAQKKQQNSTRNDLMRFVVDCLNFARKKKLFTIIPGGVRYGNETADLSLLLVTRARVIGVTCFGFGGTVTCRGVGKKWEQTLNGEKKEIINPMIRAEKDTILVRNAMEHADIKDVPYETILIFTGRGVRFEGEKPDCVMTPEIFFKRLENDADLKKGPLEPKELGLRLDKLVPKQNKKK